MAAIYEKAKIVAASGRGVVAVVEWSRAVEAPGLSGRIVVGAVVGPRGVVGGISQQAAARRVTV